MEPTPFKVEERPPSETPAPTLRLAEAVSSALTRAVRLAVTSTGEVVGVIPAAVVWRVVQPSAKWQKARESTARMRHRVHGRI